MKAMTLSHFRGKFGHGQLEVCEEHWMPAEAVMSMSMWYLDYTEPGPAFIPVPAYQTGDSVTHDLPPVIQQ